MRDRHHQEPRQPRAAPARPAHGGQYWKRRPRREEISEAFAARAGRHAHDRRPRTAAAMSIRETQAGGFTMDGQAELWNWVHHANIERYQRMLTTSLTPVERRFIERRIGE